VAAAHSAADRVPSESRSVVHRSRQWTAELRRRGWTDAFTTDDAIASAAKGAHPNVIVLGRLIALLLSLTTGSATVGIVSATGIIAPMVRGGGLEASLLVVAIGAGSLGLNYVNHAGFWLVEDSFGMDLTQATKPQTVVQTLVSVLALGMALLLSVFA